MDTARLLLIPICHVAPESVRGDVDRISDGPVTIFLLPEVYGATDEASLRRMPAEKPVPEI